MEGKKDKLDEIFELQNKFDSFVTKNRNLESVTPKDWILKETLALISELSELISEVNFKWWKNEKEINWQNVKEELVDILHFFTSMCLKVNMTSEELHKLYLQKNKENFDRQNGLSLKPGYEIKKPD